MREPEDDSQRWPPREYPLRTPTPSGPSGGESFSRPRLPARSARSGGGDAARNRGDRDRHGGKGFAPNLPRGSGLDWRAEPPPRAGGEAGTGPEVVEGWERRCGATALATGGALEVSGLGRGRWGWEGRSRGGGMCWGCWAITQPGRRSSGPGKLLCLSFQSAKEPGGWRFFPGEANLPGTALGGGELPEPALLASLVAAFAGQRCGLLAFSLSQASQVQGSPREPEVLL